METPKLKEGAYSILSSEYETGIVLNTDGTRNIENGGGQVFWTFDNLEDAEKFISDELIRNQDKEYCLYDSEGVFVYLDCIDGRRK